MKLDTSILVPGSPGLCSAREWNKFAKTINTLWNSRATAGVTLTKGEPWIFEAGEDATTSSINANGPIYRVYVWRSDKWDFGSSTDPTAFFLGGAFTQINSQSANRIARITRNESKKTRFDPAFSANTSYDGPVYFISTSKDEPPQLAVGNGTGATRDGESEVSFAWLLDADSGVPTSGFTPITVASMGTSLVVGLSCLPDYVGLLSYQLFRQYQISASSNTFRVGAVNMHGILATQSKYVVTSRGGVAAGIVPSPPYFDTAYNNDVAWSAFLGLGVGSLWSIIAAQKQKWDVDYLGREFWFSASTEYGGALSWGTYGDYVDGEPWTAALVCIRDDGTPADGYTKRLKLLHGGEERAIVFCCDSGGKVWFGGDIYQIKSNTTDTGYNPSNTFQLYTFDPATQDIQVFNEFNGRVWDCQQFGEDQYIVVGEFTEYKGHPASYLVFIDGSGKRLHDLTWPS